MFPLMFSPMVPNLYKLGNDYNIPPTIYALLNSYVNFSKEEPEKIKDLAKIGRTMFFDFDYPLSNKITKEQFETMILNHFLMRRIGYETVTAENSSVSLQNGTTKYALYPVWLLNTTWNGQKYTFAMNGQTGKIAGDLPMDKGKFWTWLVGISGAVAAAAYAVSYLIWL